MSGLEASLVMVWGAAFEASPDLEAFEGNETMAAATWIDSTVAVGPSGEGWFAALINEGADGQPVYANLSTWETQDAAVVAACSLMAATLALGAIEAPPLGGAYNQPYGEA